MPSTKATKVKRRKLALGRGFTMTLSASQEAELQRTMKRNPTKSRVAVIREWIDIALAVERQANQER